MKQVIHNADGTQTVVALEDGNLISGTVQDCTAIAEDAKERHAIGAHGPSAEMKHAARVPKVLIEAYLNRNGITLNEFTASQEHQRRFLNDPAIAHFRIWKGKL